MAIDAKVVVDSKVVECRISGVWRSKENNKLFTCDDVYISGFYRKPEGEWFADESGNLMVEVCPGPWVVWLGR